MIKKIFFKIGCIGLMKAINNFDVHYGVQFSTYAVPIIMGEIKTVFLEMMEPLRFLVLLKRTEYLKIK